MNPENHLVELVESRNEDEVESKAQDFDKIQFIDDAFGEYLNIISKDENNETDISFHVHGRLNRSMLLSLFDFKQGESVYLEDITEMKNNHDEIEKFRKSINKFLKKD